MPSQIIKVVGPQGEPLAAAKAFVNGLPLPPSGADGQFFAATYQGIPVGRKQKSPRAREPRSDQKASNSDPERKSDLGCARAERDLRRGCLNGAGGYRWAERAPANGKSANKAPGPAPMAFAEDA